MSGYPVGVFLKGAKIFAKTSKGAKISLESLRSVKIFSFFSFYIDNVKWEIKIMQDRLSEFNEKKLKLDKKN